MPPLHAVPFIFEQMPWFTALFFAVMGGVMGSFVHCMGYRLAHGLSLRQPPSHCPACGTVLRIRDLVPIISYACARGRCRHCNVVIPRIYWWSEWLACLFPVGIWFLTRGFLATVVICLIWWVFVGFLSYLYHRKR